MFNVWTMYTLKQTSKFVYTILDKEWKSVSYNCKKVIEKLWAEKVSELLKWYDWKDVIWFLEQMIAEEYDRLCNFDEEWLSYKSLEIKEDWAEIRFYDWRKEFIRLNEAWKYMKVYEVESKLAYCNEENYKEEIIKMYEAVYKYL